MATTLFEQGKIDFAAGLSYKHRKEAEWIRGWDFECRNTRHGYTTEHWNNSGQCISTADGLRNNFKQTRQRTFRGGLDKVLTAEEVKVLLNGGEDE